MAVELDNTYVTPYPEDGLETFWGPATSDMTPNYMPENFSPIGDALRIYTNRYCNPSTWLSTFKAEVVKTKFLVPMQVQLKAFGVIDQLCAEGMPIRDAFAKVSKSMKPFQDVRLDMVKYPEEPRVFSGDLLTALHGLAHSMFGGGKPVTFPIENVGLNVKLNEVSKFVDAFSSLEEGVHSIDVDFAYDVRKDSFSSGWTLGNVTLKAVGTAEVDANGNWTFNGVIRAYDDVYDANPSTHRDWLGESATSFLSKVMQNSYVIKIPGQIPVSASGKR